MNVLVASWNLGMLNPTTSQRSLMDLSQFVSSKNEPDLIAVGYQELVSQGIALTLEPDEAYFGTGLITKLMEQPEAEKSASPLLRWTNDVSKALSEKYSAKYSPLYARRCVAIGLLVFVRMDDMGSHGFISDDVPDHDTANLEEEPQEHQYRIMNCRIGTIGVGLGGIYGNKAAVGFSMDIQHQNDMQIFSLCFVAVHLQAHEGRQYFLSRNEDMRHIRDCLVFTPVVPTTSGVLITSSQSWKNPKKWLGDCLYPFNNAEKSMTFDGHDLIFICGDFNYRIEQPREKVLEMIEAKRFKELSALDELTFALKNEKVFEGFSEGTIDFEPTYKLSNKIPTKKVEDATTDTLKYSLKRKPGYCDRILFKVGGQTKLTVNNTAYRTSSLLYGWSDHNPILGCFRISLSGSPGSRSGALPALNRSGKIELAAKVALAVARSPIDYKAVRGARNTRIVRFTVIPVSAVLALFSFMFYFYYFV